MTSPLVILASSSINRLRLLRSINIEPKVVCSNYEEDLPKTLPVREFVEQTAHEKLKSVRSDMREKQEPFDVIIACDTVIYFENEIIGKPVNKEDAIATLKRLRNKTHLCYTGVSLAYPDETEDVFNVETTIAFGDFPDSLIEAYVATGEPLSKAGSYGIQGFASVFVKSVHGCYSNIVGLPIHEVHRRLILKGVLKRLKRTLLKDL
ncbi:unnamed protein product [Auanema sp. JU1783]|nr:unnamed protein product [Auanema sp. JU1783]